MNENNLKIFANIVGFLCSVSLVTFLGFGLYDLYNCENIIDVLKYALFDTFLIVILIILNKEK